MSHHSPREFDGKWFTHPPMRNALIAGVIAVGTFVFSFSGLLPAWPARALYILSIIIGGYHWTREGVEELIRERVFTVDALMIAATVGSAILDMWEEAAFLVFLYGAAEGLEEYTYAKTRSSIRKLLDLAPAEARLLRDGREETVRAETLKPGDIFRVLPGESIPTDGIIINGASSVNEATITGESIPVDKSKGARVFAATLNETGMLEIEASAAFADNTLSKMIHMVEEAQEHKGKTQAFIDHFGRVYTPWVFIGSLALLLVPFLFDQPFEVWAHRAVVLLVAAAPCALIMSTPVAIAAGIGRAGRNGVLIKGGAYLEQLGKIKAVAFDKTGTLTRGTPVVTDVYPVTGSAGELLSLAHSVERFSEHPLARAIVNYAKSKNIVPAEAYDFRIIPGYGAGAVIDGRAVWVGRLRESSPVEPDEQTQTDITRLRHEGKTIVFITEAEELRGIIAIRDELRPNAGEIVNRIKEMGLEVCMLTGDNETTARAFARELGITDVRAGLKPEDKIAAIIDLEKSYGAIAMVGDGVNDAPALARASLGVAMGTAGTDAAIEAADIALMADDLSRLIFAIALGKKTESISKQNIVFSISVLALLIPAALTGMATITAAVFIHEASELLAVANGVRVAKVNLSK